MSKIEAKRKELEKQIDDEIKLGQYSMDYLPKAKLIFFNLGVEMARKEFLDLLNELYNKYWKDLEQGNEVKFAMMFMELKQSLDIQSQDGSTRKDGQEVVLTLHSSFVHPDTQTPSGNSDKSKPLNTREARKSKEEKE